MTKKDLIEKTAEALSRKGDSMHITKAAVGHVLEALGDVAAAELLGGGEVPLPGLGKLKAEQRKARTGRNPKTGAVMEIPERWAVKFSAGKELKEAQR